MNMAAEKLALNSGVTVIEYRWRCYCQFMASLRPQSDEPQMNSINLDDEELEDIRCACVILACEFAF